MATWQLEIPTITITQDQVDTKLQCSVCCEEFEVREAASLLECAHMFHPRCIHPWLQLNTTCPVCRHDLQTPEDTPLSGEDADMEMSSSLDSSDDEMFTLPTIEIVNDDATHFVFSLISSRGESTEPLPPVLSSMDSSSSSDWSFSMIADFPSSSDSASDSD
uniref:RING-type domain-containing protein n=1 Tax=Graphocephala atropunctata TaxID=36148 RepID=A0A1B6MIN3_9HEMI